jgi:hypothetical protein
MAMCALGTLRPDLAVLAKARFESNPNLWFKPRVCSIIAQAFLFHKQAEESYEARKKKLFNDAQSKLIGLVESAFRHGWSDIDDKDYRKVRYWCNRKDLELEIAD